MNLNLHTPSVPIFVVSLVFAVLALIGHVVLIPFVCNPRRRRRDENLAV